MNMFSIDHLISIVIRVLIGWILIDRVPYWLGLGRNFTTVTKILGLLIIISALLCLL